MPPTMTMNKALSAYAVASTSTLPPLTAVVRLYEKALTHLHLARDAARDRRFDRHFQHIDRTITILGGLESILDLEACNDIGATLQSFYRSLIGQAALAAARKDPVAATEAVIRQLAIMTKTWQAIAAQRGLVSNSSGTPAKAPQASVIGRSMDHAHGRRLG